MSAPSSDIIPGETYLADGKYQLLERIGRGGMAEVYRARSIGLAGFEKIVAIKRILPHLAANESFAEMFLREARITVSLSHANIVQVFDLGQAGDSYFMAMEYVHGLNLARLQKRVHQLGMKLPTAVCCYAVAEAAKGLDYAHRRRGADSQALGIVHRDVSPQNILLSAEGEVKIADFGVAKAMGTVSVTDFGEVKGKFAYMSPEQATGQPIDHRADIFGLGAVLYKALAGVGPYYTSSQKPVDLDRIPRGAVTPITERVPDIPNDLDLILTAALAPAADDRYQAAGQMYEDLTAFLYSLEDRAGAIELAEYVQDVGKVLPDTAARAKLGENLRAALGGRSLERCPGPSLSQTRAERAAPQLASPATAGPSGPVRTAPTAPEADRKAASAKKAKALTAREVGPVAGSGVADENLMLTMRDPLPHTATEPVAGKDRESRDDPPPPPPSLAARKPRAQPTAAAPASQPPETERAESAPPEENVEGPARLEATAGPVPSPEFLEDETLTTRVWLPSREPGGAVLLLVRLGDDAPVLGRRLASELGKTGAIPFKTEPGELGAYFGPPVHTERMAEFAVRAALQLFATATEVSPEASTRICIGVYQTPEVGHPGEGPIKAGRLLANQQPGGITVSGRVRAICRGAFVFSPAGVIPLEGAPVTVYRAMAETERTQAYGPLMGRAEEMARIGDILGRAGQGSGALVALAGEAGSGKSHFLHAVQVRVREYGVSWHRGRSYSHASLAPFFTAQSLLRDVAGVGDEDPPDAVRDKLQRLAQLGLSEEELLCADTPATDAATMSSALRKAAIGLSRDGVAVFAVDDLQWADKESTEILGDVARATSDLPVVIVVAGRPPFQGPPGANRVYEMKLGPLDRGTCRQLLEETLAATEVPDALLSLVYAKSGGNPLFVIELAKALQEMKAITIGEDGTVTFDEDVAARGPVPGSLRARYAAEAARLAPAERGILEAAAVIGNVFDPVVLAVTADESPAALRRRLSRLAVRGIIMRTPAGLYRFRHDLLRDALYENLGEQARAVQHGRVAKALVGTQEAADDPAALAAVADHYARAGQLVEAIACLESSAEALMEASSPRAALDRYLEAARLAEQADDGRSMGASRRIRIGLQIGGLAAAAMRVEAGEEQLAVALKLAHDLGDRNAETRALLRRGQLRLHAGRFEEAVADLEHVRSRVESSSKPDLALLSQIYGALGDAHERNGDLLQAVDYLEMAVRNASERDDLGEAGRYLAALGRSSAKLGEPERASVQVQEALSLAIDRHDDALRVRALSAQGIVRMLQSHYEDALVSFREAFEVARGRDDGDEMAIQEHNLGDMYLRLGNYARAYAHLRSSYDAAKAAGWDWMIWINLVLLGYLEALRGDVDQGIAEIEAALVEIKRREFVQDLMQGHRLLADLYRRKGDKDQARRHLEEALKAAQQMHWVPAIQGIERELAP